MGSYGYLLGNKGSAYYVGHQTIKDLLAFVDRHQEPRKASNKIRSEEDDLQVTMTGSGDRALQSDGSSAGALPDRPAGQLNGRGLLHSLRA
jgi:hypothetical protein